MLILIIIAFCLFYSLLFGSKSTLLRSHFGCCQYLFHSAILGKGHNYRSTCTGFWLQRVGRQTHKQGKKQEAGGRVRPLCPLTSHQSPRYVQPSFSPFVAFISLRSIPPSLAWPLSSVPQITESTISWSSCLSYLCPSQPSPRENEYHISVLQGLPSSAPNGLLQAWSHHVCSPVPLIALLALLQSRRLSSPP